MEQAQTGRDKIVARSFDEVAIEESVMLEDDPLYDLMNEQGVDGDLSLTNRGFSRSNKQYAWRRTGT